MALQGYTSAVGDAAGEGRTAGRIAVGMRVDLSAVALDPLQVPPDEFAHAPQP